VSWNPIILEDYFVPRDDPPEQKRMSRKSGNFFSNPRNYSMSASSRVAVKNLDLYIEKINLASRDFRRRILGLSGTKTTLRQQYQKDYNILCENMEIILAEDLVQIHQIRLGLVNLEIRKLETVIENFKNVIQHCEQLKLQAEKNVILDLSTLSSPEQIASEIILSYAEKETNLRTALKMAEEKYKDTAFMVNEEARMTRIERLHTIFDLMHSHLDKAQHKFFQSPHIQQKLNCLLLDARTQEGEFLRTWFKNIQTKDVTQIPSSIILNHVDKFTNAFLSKYQIPPNRKHVAALMVHRAIYVRLARFGVIPAPSESERVKPMRDELEFSGSSSLQTQSSLLTSDGEGETTFAAVESQRENYASLNERFQSQCAWMSDLSLAQLGVPWKFIPQSPTPQVGRVARGSFFQQPIQFPSPYSLPLTLKESKNEQDNGTLALAEDAEEVEVSYQPAIVCFRYLDSLVCPADMCYCLCDTVEIIYSIANQTSSQSENKIIGADDFLPLFLYTVIQSKISGIHRVMFILKNYNADLDLKSEIGYYISLVEIAIDTLMNATLEQYLPPADADAEENDDENASNGDASEENVKQPVPANVAEEDDNQSTEPLPIESPKKPVRRDSEKFQVETQIDIFGSGDSAI